MRVTTGMTPRRRGVLLLLLGAAVMLPAPAFAQTPAAGKRRTTCVDCQAEVRRTRALERLDSLRWEFENVRLSDTQRERLRREMSLAMRDLQVAIGELRVEMGDLERAEVGARMAPRVAYSYQRRAPAGYLGVSFDGLNVEDYRDDERIIRFYAHPRIALVEPSSPAERAGIRAGDTLLALNGLDVVDREISLTKMLVPQSNLSVRLRRDGSQRDVKVTVGRAPDYVVRRWTPVHAAPAAPMPSQATRGGAAAAVRVGTPAPARAPTAVSSGGSAVTSVFVYNEGVAGAKMETVTEGLGKALGVARGVLVVRVGPGTSANRAGLRDGDVILRVAGMDVATVRDLQMALQRHGHDGGITLTVVREKRERELILRQ